jgi:type II secretory pathway component PulF
MRRLSHFLHRLWPRRVRLAPARTRSGPPREALFAAAFAELLQCGLPAANALGQTAEVMPGRRFSGAVHEMVRQFRSGYSLEVSLRRTGCHVDPGLLAALATGEDTGPLADELAAYARSLIGADDRALARAFGRTAAGAAFAAALGRLLAHRPLTPELIVAAGRLVVGRYPEFTPGVLQDIHDGLMNGVTFPDLIGRHPGLFDALFVRCVAACQTRPEMRAALERLGLSAG